MTTEYEQEFEYEMEELKKEATVFEGSKRERIERGARALVKNGDDKETIATRIKEKLAGYVSPSYINKILTSEFKRIYEKKPKQVINADGSISEKQGEEGEDDSDDDETQNKPKLTRAEQRQIEREEYEKNKYRLNSKAIAEVKKSEERAQPDLETEQQQYQYQTHEVILGPVHAPKLKSLLDKDRNIVLTFNPESMMVTKLRIQEDQS